MVQAEMIIHHAITQTAKEISTYGYVLSRVGITERIQKSNKAGQEFEQTVDSVVTSVEEFAGAFGNMDISQMQTSGQALQGNIETIISDPESVFQGVLGYIKSGITKAATVSIVGGLARGSIQKQVSLLDKNADEYLEKLGVVGGMDGLDFSKSECFTNTSGKGNISVVVTFSMKNNMFPWFDFGEHEYVLSANTLSW